MLIASLRRVPCGLALAALFMQPLAVSAASCGIKTVVPSNQLAPVCDASSYTEHIDLPYGADPAQRLDLYLPAGAQAGAGPYPLVLWLHGGQWRSGDKSEVKSAFTLVCRGYAVAAANYRLSNDVAFPAQIHDVKAALRYLRQQAAVYRIDPQRVALFGVSAGGHLAALTGVSQGVAALDEPAPTYPEQSSAVQAVVDWYGPTDFARMDSALLRAGCPASAATHGESGSPESRLLGCTVDDRDCAAAVDLADPIEAAGAGDPPTLVMHGDEDCQVPAQQGSLLYRALRRGRASASYMVVKGAGHGTPEWNSASVVDALVEFLDARLGGDTSCR